MKELKVVKNTTINGILCDFYANGQGEFFMTRQQIGQALEYDNPTIAISKIHERHKERFEKLSVLTKLTSTDNKQYETYLYSAKGVYEICRWSRQPKADEFYDKVYDILEGLRLGYLNLNNEKQSIHWQQTRLENKEKRLKETKEIDAFIQYAKENGSRHAGWYYKSLSLLADSVAGIKPNDREQATASQLNILTLVEHIITEEIKAGIAQQRYYKEIYKACKAKIEQFQEVACLTKNP